MRPTLARVTIATLAIVLAAGDAAAQRVPAQEKRPGDQKREMLERRLRERTGELVQRRLELTEAQMTRLQTTSRQFERQRASLLMKERDIRRDLRQEMLAGDKANQSRVAEMIDQTLLLEKQRLDLLQEEQRQLAQFLSPVQRAKLLGLQAELRRRTQDMRRGNRP